MDSIIKKIFFPNKFQIIGVSIQETSTSYELLKLKRNGAQISVSEQKSFANLEHLLENVNKNLAVILTIDGKGVLNKKIDLENEQDLQWYKNFDSKKLDFFQFKYGSDIFLSITKNETVLKNLEPFKLNNLKVIDVFIGSLTVIPVQAILNDTFEICTTLYSFKFIDNKLHSISRNDSNNLVDYPIENEKLNSSSIALFGAFLIHWLKQEEIERTQFIEEKELNEVYYENAFNRTGKVILIFFLFTLFVSYLGVLYYSNKNTDLNYQCQYSKETISKLESIEKNKKQKLEILNETGLISSKYLTNYSFDILNSVPNSIQIIELNINPAEKEIKEAKKILFENKKIKLKGIAKEEFLFNQWVNSIKQLNWIKKTEILSIKRNKQGQLEFEIKINIKDV